MPVNIVHIFEVADYEEQVANAAKLLRDGGVVVLPTETVYGAAGLINQARSVERLHKLRSGARTGPFTVHVARPDDALKYLADVNDLGRRMMRKLWPGPVALMFDVPAQRRKQVAAETAAQPGDLYDESGTITLRCPDHIVTTDILSEVPGPIALTRVERAGAGSFDLPDGAADLILDGGPSRYSKPSTIVRVREKNWELVRAGVYDQRIIERMMRTTLLFVCSGNTCRSPMAEAIARRLIAQQMNVSEDELEAKGVIVLSAGSFAMPGSRATPQAVDAVRAIGGDLSRHRSRPLSVELIHQADMIYTMGRAHLQAVTSLVPSAAEKSVTLDPRGDIDDPIGGDASLYQELATTLKGLIEDRLKERVLQ